MKKGMVRKLDNLGRVVIPKEFRTEMELNCNEEVEIVLVDQAVLITKTGKKKCEGCNKVLDKTYRFCPFCGKEV